MRPPRLYTYDSLLPTDDPDQKLVTIERYKELAKEALVDEKYLLPGVHLHDYIPSPDTSPTYKTSQIHLSVNKDNNPFSLGQNQGYEKTNSQEKSQTIVGGSLIVLQATKSSDKSPSGSPKRGFVSQSGRRIRVQHHEEGNFDLKTSEKSFSTLEGFKHPTEIIKQYRAEYLSMSKPFSNRPRDMAITHLSKEKAHKTEFDEDIEIPPHLHSQKYSTPHLSLLFAKVIRNIPSNLN